MQQSSEIQRIFKFESNHDDYFSLNSQNIVDSELSQVMPKLEEQTTTSWLNAFHYYDAGLWSFIVLST